MPQWLKILIAVAVFTVPFIAFESAHAGEFYHHAGSCEISQRVKIGALRMTYATALIALRQCGKPVGKPLNILAVR